MRYWSKDSFEALEEETSSEFISDTLDGFEL